MKILCLLSLHQWEPTNPERHDFLGRVCRSCPAQEYWARNEVTRRKHYEAKRNYKRFHPVKGKLFTEAQ